MSTLPLYCILFYLVKVDVVADEPSGETFCSANKLKVELFHPILILYIQGGPERMQ